MKGGKHNPSNKKDDIRRESRLTRPPRLEAAPQKRYVHPKKKKPTHRKTKKKK